jgi:hypothetical protein
MFNDSSKNAVGSRSSLSLPNEGRKADFLNQGRPSFHYRKVQGAGIRITPQALAG